VEPSGLTLSVISASEIDLSWTNNSTHQNAVGIEWSTDSTPWTQLTVTDSARTTTSYRDTSVAAGTTYQLPHCIRG